MRPFQLLLLLFTLLSAFAANGEVFEFEMTFDGTSIRVLPPHPAGTTFDPGDSFELELRAVDGDFWRVEAPYSEFFPLSFGVSESGSRTADIEAVFSLEGIEQLRLTDDQVVQAEVHIGAETWSLDEGLEFDSVFLTWNLSSSDAPSTTIEARRDVFEDFDNEHTPFFRSDKIAYVPEASALAQICGVLLAALALPVSRRRA